MNRFSTDYHQCFPILQNEHLTERGLLTKIERSYCHLGN